MDVNVGDTVWLARVDRREADGQPAIVSKVGRKYFEVDGRPRPRFFIDDGKHDNDGYEPRYWVYPSKEHHEEVLRLQAEEKRKSKILSAIHDHTKGYGRSRPSHSLSDLERVAKILGIEIE